MKRSLIPSNKRLTEQQIGKIVGSVAAGLRKFNPFSVEAQDLIEFHWEEVEWEIAVAMVSAIERVLERRRNGCVAMRVQVTPGGHSTWRFVTRAKVVPPREDRSGANGDDRVGFDLL